MPTQKKQTRKFCNTQDYRGSHFRGVSINGNKWQVFFIVNNKKYYVGQMLTEAGAATLYDKIAVFHHGLDAKTNFSYTPKQVREIVENMPTV